MKYNLIILAFIVLSCGSRKEAQYEMESAEKTVKEQTEPTTEEVMDKGLLMTHGIVRDRSKDEGCGFLIEVELDGEKVLLDPLSLADEFKVDGKSVKIQYRMSRRPSQCMFANPIVIDSITE
ncbi:hypothetical protein N8987_02885 [Crocinitomix sp.]|nr:hypothetical protein [Crocinitomix sp.]